MSAGAPPVDELAETGRLLKLLCLRVAPLILAAGALWSLPAAGLLTSALIGIGTAVLIYPAGIGLLVAATGLRNMIGRRLSLAGRPGAIRLLGAAVLVFAIALAIGLFQIGGLIVG